MLFASFALVFSVVVLVLNIRTGRKVERNSRYDSYMACKNQVKEGLIDEDIFQILWGEYERKHKLK